METLKVSQKVVQYSIIALQINSNTEISQHNIALLSHYSSIALSLYRSKDQRSIAVTHQRTVNLINLFVDVM